MGTEQWISGSVGVLFLALGVLCVTRGARSPLAPPLASLCFALFVYAVLEVARHVADDPVWDYLDAAAAALITPPALALVATFVGKRRALRVPLALASAYFAAVAIACVLPIAHPSLAWFPGSREWALAMLAGMAGSYCAVPLVLLAHAKAASRGERARTQLFAAALALGVGGTASDLAAIAGADTPRVAAPCLMLAVLLLGTLALRADVIERVTALATLNTVALGALAVLGHLVVLDWLGESSALMLLGAVTVTLALLAALRPLVDAIAEERERAKHLATLGRLSAQMAHDLRNPLAAIKGAAQFLEEERRQGRSIDAQQELVALIVEQADRLGRVVDDYQRLGRVEPSLAPVRLGELARQVASAQQLASGETGVAVTCEVRGQLAPLHADRELLSASLENLVRNAREAIAQTGRAGRVTIVVEPREREVALRVEDDGPGMDARVRERAFDDFFTPKASGSGLGLAFVAKVAAAHGGSARVTSEEGRGTQVELRLPIREADATGAA